MLRLDEDDFHLGKFRDYEILDACNGYILFQFSQELQSILGFDCYTVLNFSCLPLLKGSRIGIPAFSMLAFDPPASPYYKVLLVFYPSAPSSNKPYEVHIFSSETRQWTCPTVDPEIGHSMTNFGPTICLNGLAYQRGVDRISDTGGGVRVLRRMSYCFMWREGVDPTPCGNTGTRREGGIWRLGSIGMNSTLCLPWSTNELSESGHLKIFAPQTTGYWGIRWIYALTIHPVTSLSIPFLEAVFLSSHCCGLSHIHRLNYKGFDLFCHFKGAKTDEPYVIPILYC